MKRPPLEWLRDMATEAELAIRFIAGHTLETFVADPQALRAVVRCLEVVGEAAGRLPPEIRALAPGVPWPQIIAMRNRLIHDYIHTDNDVVWSTATLDLPPFLAAIEQLRCILAQSEEPHPPEISE